MQSRWPTVRLGDHVDACLGKMLDANKNKGTPQPYLGNSNVRWGRFELDDLAEMRFEPHEEERYGLAAGDLVVCEGGEPGRCAIWTGSIPGMKIQKALHRIRPRETFDAYYLFYWFQFAAKAGLLEPYFTGTTIKHLTGKAIAALELPQPPLQIQRALVDVLKTLDDRIELLRQTNATLESIAQALFKSWFIDFDPVRAKAEGREPEGMDAATAQLFPGEFEESVLGLTPRGWAVTTIADLCAKVANGGTPSRSKPDFWTDGTVPWFKTGELFDTLLMSSTERITADAVANSSVKVLPRHSVLMAIYAAPTVGRLGVLTAEAAFNQACTGMLAKPSVGPWFLFQTLYHGRDWFNSRANGAAQQNISKAIVESYQCIKPTLELLRAFNDIVAGLYASVERNASQTRTLAELRDALLPRLISGKLRIPEVQAEIEEALA